jgi:CheY-like chemotaxis protein/HPt (histidine-containing phosphotransfer) domain-containing protein
MSSIASEEKPMVRADGKILIVDDNATNRRVLGSQLTHAGYRVTAAGSGAEALHLLQAAAAAGETYDIVVTDFLMPDMDGAMLGERIGKNPDLASTRLIMLTSLDRQGDMPRFAALGFAAYLTKPVRARELLDCVQRVLSGDARQWHGESRPMITRNTLSEARTALRLSGRVLVVEDNVVNQKVAARFLERLGCTVRIAEHGADGVTACLEERFDVVLMDLQMPVMDGLTATRRIRELEVGHRTPIIALTANAMRGDQERCEAAGMDGFLTKPIEVERLSDILARFGMARPATAAETASAHATEAALASVIGAAPTPQPEVSPPIDLARVNEITGDDVEFAHELLTTFLASSEAQLKEIAAAISASDREALARAAHKLKGACANVYAHELRTISLSLETLAASAPTADLERYSAQLQREFTRTRDYLQVMLPDSARIAS